MKSTTPNLILYFLLSALVLGACSFPSRNDQASPTATLSGPDPLMLTHTSIVVDALATDQSESLTATAVAEQNVTSEPDITPLVTASPTPVDLPTDSVQPPALPEPSVEVVQPIPTKYVLQKDEFPWCIARRFNINPLQLIRYNGLFIGQIFYKGQVIIIPPNPKPFPGRRALHPHTATYIVKPGDSLNKVACYYGDISPQEIAQLNNIEAPYSIRAGQELVLQPSYSAQTFAPPVPTDPVLEVVTEVKTEPVVEVVETQLPPQTTSIPEEPLPTATLSPTPKPTATQAPIVINIVPTAPLELLQSSEDDRRCAVGLENIRIDFDPEKANEPLAPVVLSENKMASFFATGLDENSCGDAKGHAIIGDGQFELGSKIRGINCSWLNDETINAQVLFPDNKIYQVPVSGQIIPFESALTDPAGLYEFIFSSQSGITESITFNLVQPDGPRAMLLNCIVAKQTSNSVYLYNFAPGERVTINVYKSVYDESAVLWTDNPIGSKKVLVDANGRLLIQLVSESIENYRFVFIGEESGPALVVAR
ncbi:LysM peptidoglycan-binding domain-containing protein [Chloroflexota bacterium]